MTKKIETINGVNEEFIHELEGKAMDYPDLRCVISIVSGATRCAQSFFPTPSIRELGRTCAGAVHGLTDDNLARVSADLVYYHGNYNVASLALDLEQSPVLLGTVGAIASHFLSTIER